MNLNFITFIVCLNINYRYFWTSIIPINTTIYRILYVNKVKIFVHKLFNSFALLSYNIFIFIPTQLERVIHIHRFVLFFRRYKTPQRAVLTRPFFIVHNSNKYPLLWQ